MRLLIDLKVVIALSSVCLHPLDRRFLSRRQMPNSRKRDRLSSPPRRTTADCTLASGVCVLVSVVGLALFNPVGGGRLRVAVRGRPTRQLRSESVCLDAEVQRHLFRRTIAYRGRSEKVFWGGRVLFRVRPALGPGAFGGVPSAQKNPLAATRRGGLNFKRHYAAAFFVARLRVVFFGVAFLAAAFFGVAFLRLAFFSSASLRSLSKRA